MFAPACAGHDTLLTNSGRELQALKFLNSFWKEKNGFSCSTEVHGLNLIEGVENGIRKGIYARRIYYKFIWCRLGSTEVNWAQFFRSFAVRNAIVIVNGIPRNYFWLKKVRLGSIFLTKVHLRSTEIGSVGHLRSHELKKSNAKG